MSEDLNRRCAIEVMGWHTRDGMTNKWWWVQDTPVIAAHEWTPETSYDAAHDVLAKTVERVGWVAFSEGLVEGFEDDRGNTAVDEVHREAMAKGSSKHAAWFLAGCCDGLCLTPAQICQACLNALVTPLKEGEKT